ncbi:hypothetical protein PA905_43830 [Planktothrix agardhii CCAP 1459/11A]|uniref:Uncharacterized protein n=1 Tax=Planktothrix agardhii CCAP 1459/11A TaxID=282420 RepID=A0A4P5ZRF9_PLAAG|nr:hypothetical protein PA905_43830 [Planktothrix agardhii CCAP 1459/11A]CAD5919508.1 hypothetical protein NO108_00946 [Planktothrix rubescens]
MAFSTPILAISSSCLDFSLSKNDDWFLAVVCFQKPS